MKSISLMTFVAGVALSALTGSAFAAGDPAAGEKVFAKCKACHQIGESEKTPSRPS
jgi:cytochrome c